VRSISPPPPIASLPSELTLTARNNNHNQTAARQNERLREWLGDNGVWMTDRSGWGVPPHPLGGSPTPNVLCVRILQRVQ